MSDPDSLPWSEDLGGPCPNCGRVSSFTQSDKKFPVGGGRYRHLAVHLTCQGCDRGLIVIERIGARASGGWEPVHWWPIPGAGLLDDDAVPVKVSGAYDEGMRCIAVQAPRAAAVMFRATLALIVSDKGSEAARAKFGLKNKLKQMAADGDLHPSLAAWVETIRDVGNGGAHPDELPEPDLPAAEELGRLCRRLIEFMYEMEARIKRSRASSEPEATSAE